MGASFHDSQSRFRAALCDSFNTPLALEVLLRLVSRVNVYINDQSSNLNVSVIERIASWIGKMLRMFGLGEGDSIVSDNVLGWGEEHAAGAVNVSIASCDFPLFDLLFGSLIVLINLAR